nr:Hpt domain-containing protein [Bacteriovorax sp. HI3]
MEIMKDQKLVYLSRRQAEVAQLKESLAKDDFEFSQVVGHRLKGHGETFGFPQISALGISLETAAKDRNMEKLKEIVKSLDEMVEENIRLINA